MSLAWSNKNIETDKAPNPKMIHLPFKGMFGEENHSANDYESQKTIIRPKTPVNQDWGLCPLFSLVNNQYQISKQNGRLNKPMATLETIDKDNH